MTGLLLGRTRKKFQTIFKDVKHYNRNKNINLRNFKTLKLKFIDLHRTYGI